jgi:hypothetical protein
MRRLLVVVAGVLLAAQLTGCQSYLFRQSDRLTISWPRSSSTVREPLTISWRAKDFVAPRDGSYAVFVDRDPMPPGDGLGDYAPQNRQGIYVLDRTSLHLDALTPQAGVDPAEQNHHDVTVVLLDRAGHRIGEYAAFTEFTVEPPQ